MTILLAIFWLLAADVLLSTLGWRGMTVFGERWLAVTILILGAFAWWLAAYDSPIKLLPILIGGALGLAIFLAFAALRQHRLTPDALFAPGEHARYSVSHLHIPIADGPLPAVLLEPLHGSSVGVLVLHGAGDHKTHYTWPLLHGIVAAGHAACAIDVDGHGDNPRVLDFPTVLDDVRAGVAWLRERYAQVVVVGISQGGSIAARAVGDGVAVDALALLETPISINVTRAVIRREARIVSHPVMWALHREVGTIGLARSWRTPPVRCRIGTADLINRLDVLGSVGRVRCPLLLCYGGSDAVVPVEQAHRMAEASPQGSTLIIVPRATHLSLSIDRRVARLVGQWLRETLELNQKT